MVGRVGGALVLFTTDGGSALLHLLFTQTIACSLRLGLYSTCSLGLVLYSTCHSLGPGLYSTVVH